MSAKVRCRKSDQSYGDGILQTLKSQDVRRMEEFNMVVDVNFMTRPGEQWTVRRDAYQKVRDAFDANGTRMAERNVEVEISGDDHLSNGERNTVAAATQEAITKPAGPDPVKARSLSNIPPIAQIANEYRIIV